MEGLAASGFFLPMVVRMTALDNTDCSCLEGLVLVCRPRLHVDETAGEDGHPDCWLLSTCRLAGVVAATPVTERDSLLRG